MTKSDLYIVKAYEKGYRSTKEGKIVSHKSKMLKLTETSTGYFSFSASLDIVLLVSSSLAL